MNIHECPNDRTHQRFTQHTSKSTFQGRIGAQGYNTIHLQHSDVHREVVVGVDGGQTKLMLLMFPVKEKVVGHTSITVFPKCWCLEFNLKINQRQIL